MKRLGDVLPPVPEGDPVDVQPEAPACARCGDAGFLRVALQLRGTEWVGGQVYPCPACLRLPTVEERLERCGFGDAAPLSAWERGGVMDAAFHAVVHVVEGRHAGAFLRAGVGTGKTMLARGAGRLWVEASRSARFWNVGDLLNQLRDTFDEDNPSTFQGFLDNRVYHADLLVLDDLGAERPTPFQADVLYQIVNHWYDRRARKRLVVTTNVEPDSAEERERIGDRVLDRLRPFEVVVRGAPSRRKEFDR